MDAPLSDRGLEQVEVEEVFEQSERSVFNDAEVKTLRTKHVDVLRGGRGRGEDR